MKKIKIWLIWVWNCAKSIVEWIEYYKTKEHNKIFEYKISDIEVVCAIDIAQNKVGKDLNTAIYESPNNAYSIKKLDYLSGVSVIWWKILDGVFDKTVDLVQPISENNFDENLLIENIKKSKAEIFINMLPTGSDKASHYYADIIINKLGLSFINGMPANIINSGLYKNPTSVLVWDDIKSQLWGSILNRYINKIFNVRDNLFVDKMYHINYAGNTDFLNLMYRWESKHKSKANAVSNFETMQVIPSINVSYVENMWDRKTCKIQYEWRNFWDAPFNIKVEMEVEDSPNFAGSMIDVIRYAKKALDLKQYGILKNISALYMKTPPVKIDEELVIQKIKNLEF